MNGLIALLTVNGFGGFVTRDDLNGGDRDFTLRAANAALRARAACRLTLVPAERQWPRMVLHLVDAFVSKKTIPNAFLAWMLSVLPAPQLEVQLKVFKRLLGH